ncbi:MAG TPA: GntR family transcriptional regulator [Candidatus Pygmaiobacter gallistercoris]|nr:GntR family transcriptional regulator [Candidatus Pygmaiobacter gallistercoris]
MIQLSERRGPLIRFEDLVLDDRSPIYLQILRFVRQGIAAGTVCYGDELPSRRVLSSLLGVNPNTVQKAFHLLEEEGIIESRTGAKSIIVTDAAAATRMRAELQQREAQTAARMLRESGLEKETALALIAAFWDQPAERSNE